MHIVHRDAWLRPYTRWEWLAQKIRGHATLKTRSRRLLCESRRLLWRGTNEANKGKRLLDCQQQRGVRDKSALRDTVIKDKEETSVRAMVAELSFPSSQAWSFSTMDLPEYNAKGQFCHSTDSSRDLPAECYGLINKLADVDTMDLMAGTGSIIGGEKRTRVANHLPQSPDMARLYVVHVTNHHMEMLG